MHEQVGREKAEREPLKAQYGKSTREAAEKTAGEKAEREAVEKAARDKTERNLIEKLGEPGYSIRIARGFFECATDLRQDKANNNLFTYRTR